MHCWHPSIYTHVCPSYPTPNFIVLHFWWWWNSISHLAPPPPPPHTNPGIYCARATSLPILSPLVWSAVGPVCALTVLPLFMVQSKSSPWWVLGAQPRLKVTSTCNDKFHTTRHPPDKSSSRPVLTTDHNWQTTKPKYLQRQVSHGMSPSRQVITSTSLDHWPHWTNYKSQVPAITSFM